MEYQMFLKEVERQLRAQLGDTARISIRPIMKNNSVMLDSLSILQENENISPAIYLNDFYPRYLQGVSIKEIVGQILSLYHERRKAERMDVTCFTDWERARERVTLRLINREKNGALLQTIPHRDFLDLSLIYAYLFEDFRGGNASIKVRSEHIRMWGITEEELYPIALANMDRLTPMHFSTMREMMGELLPTQTFPEWEEKPKLYILTNERKYYGAVWMCREDVLEALPLDPARDFYVLPSSVHECILLEDTQMDPGILSGMVRDINETQVQPEEVLGQNVYRYLREEKRLIKEDTL